MCVLSLLLSPRSQVSFLCLHNRDEVLDRPVESLSLHGDLLFSKDVLGGGTWMGLNIRIGTFVTLTNVRALEADPAPLPRASRGLLVVRILSGDISLARLVEAASRGPGGGAIDLGAAYGPFNLVASGLFDAEPVAVVLSNRLPPDAARAEGCGPGLASPSAAWASLVTEGTHALSNSFFDDERWAKVRYLRSALQRLEPQFATSPPLQSTSMARLSAPATEAPSSRLCGDAASEDGAAADRRGVAREAVSPSIDVGVTAAVLASLPPLLAAGSSLMLEPGPLPGSDMAGGLAWSPLPEAEEAALQSRVFLGPISLRGELEATRATTVVVKLTLPGAACPVVAYCERRYDDEQRAAAGLPALPQAGGSVQQLEEAANPLLHTVVALDGATWTAYLCCPQPRGSEP